MFSRYGGGTVPMSRKLAWAATLVATYLALFGVGAGSWSITASGVAVGVLAAAIVGLPALRGRLREYVYGSAYVHSVSPPPSAGTVGRCELHLSVSAAGIDGVAVRVRDPAVPVSKWPEEGATVPVMVNRLNPRRVRVLWDQVLTHDQAAAEDQHWANATEEDSF